MMSNKFANFLENLATDQFKEGARNFGKSSNYANRCNQRFQLLTDVSKFLRGDK